MFRKITVLAMALGALAAFALPTSASGAWTKHHQPIQETQQIALTGQVSSHSTDPPLPGGVKCQITIKATFFVGQTTGQIDQYAVEPGDTVTNRCAGTGGFAFCQHHQLEPTNLPWQILTLPTTAAQPTTKEHSAEKHTPAHPAIPGTPEQDYLPGQPTTPAHTDAQPHRPIRASITTGLIHTNVTGAFCPVQEQATATPFNVVLTPDNVQTTNALTVSGNTQVDLGTVPFIPSHIAGQLQLEVQNTYGI